MIISIQKAKVEAKIDAAFTRGLPELTEEIKNDCNRYCKVDNGTLQASADAHSKPAQGLVIWQTPYARRQYWEIKSANADKNPNARWKWCEYAKRVHAEEWKRMAQKLFERNLR